MSTFCGNCPINGTDCDNDNCIPLNGVQRPIITVNRLYPGPSIQVCEGDTINVTVQNLLDDHGELTIHWHGIHQVDTPFMDGVPKVTQCPIPYGSSFVYTFNAAQSGTHFWHAHSGLQRADGCAGTLVVRQPLQTDVHQNNYEIDDEAHVLLINDWFDQPTLSSFIGHHLAGRPNTPDAILINGHGEKQPFETTHNTINQTVFTPREILRVTPGKTHRFRVASNGITNCPLQISIVNHTVAVIASDGRPVKPLQVDAFVMFAGERFDFVLTADKPVGNYWLQVKGLGDCSSRYELALIQYEGAHAHNLERVSKPFNVMGTILNPYNAEDIPGDDVIPIHSLEALEGDMDDVLGTDVTTYYLPLDFNSVSRYGEVSDGNMDSHGSDMHMHDGGHSHTKRAHDDSNDHTHHQDTSSNGHVHGEITAQINHVSFRVPRANLLTQKEDIDPTSLCDFSTIDPKCKSTYCECTQVIPARLGEVIELVLVDEGFGSDQSHPMHIHGHAFRVVAQQRIGDSVSVDHVKEMDNMGNIDRDLESAPLKDTVAVPDGGYTIIRFLASNPGWWLFHCHIQFHLSNGMSLVIKVGEEKDFPASPENFPTCNDWPAASTKVHKHENEDDQNMTNVTLTCTGSAPLVLSLASAWISLLAFLSIIMSGTI